MRLDEVPLGTGATGKSSDQASLKEIGTTQARWRYADMITLLLSTGLGADHLFRTMATLALDVQSGRVHRERRKSMRAACMQVESFTDNAREIRD